MRDAIIDALAYRVQGATVAQITQEVSARIGPAPASSIRSYLRLNTPKLFVKVGRGHYRVREDAQATLPLLDQRNGATALHSRRSRTALRVWAGSVSIWKRDADSWRLFPMVGRRSNEQHRSGRHRSALWSRRIQRARTRQTSQRARWSLADSAIVRWKQAVAFTAIHCSFTRRHR